MHATYQSRILANRKSFRVGHHIYVPLLNIFLCLGAMGGLYATRVNAQDQTIGEKVAAIDQHLVATDARIAQADKDRDQRHVEAVANNQRQDVQIEANADRIAHDEGYALGAFMAIMAAQTFGLIRGFQKKQ